MEEKYICPTCAYLLTIDDDKFGHFEYCTFNKCMCGYNQSGQMLGCWKYIFEPRTLMANSMASSESISCIKGPI